MSRFEFVVTSGAPKRVSSAARSHAVKNGLQRKMNADEPTSHRDSQLTIRQKSNLKGRFRLTPSQPSAPIQKTKTRQDASAVVQHYHSPTSPESGLDVLETENTTTWAEADSFIKAEAADDWDPVGSMAVAFSPAQWRVDPFETLPIEQTQDVDSLLHFFVQRLENEAAMFEIGKPWWAFAKSDAIVLHTTLGVAAVAWALLLPNPTVAISEGNRQKGLAIRGLQERLRSGDDSDATLGAIANLANMEGLEGQFDNALVHLEGLKLLVKSRGGAACLKDKIHIARAVTWADIQAAAGMDTKPLIPLIYEPDSVSLPLKVIAKAEQPNLSHLQIFERSPLDTDIQSIFLLIRKAYYAQRSPEVSASDQRTLINAADHQLATLLADQKQTSPGHTLLMCARVFLYRAMREGGPSCPITVVIVERLRDQLQAHMDKMTSSPDYWHGLLWCLCVAASSTPETGEVWDYFSASFWEIVQLAGFHRPAEQEEIMERFLWDRGLLGAVLEIPQPMLIPLMGLE